MILSPNWLTRTSVAGLSAFFIAAVSSAGAWSQIRIRSSLRAGHAPEEARLAAWLTVLETFLFLDMLFNWRWALHTHLMRLAMIYGRYEQRQYVQMAALVLLIALVIYAVRLMARKQRSRAGAVAACSGLATLACWFLEIISLHVIDAVLYRRIGGFMVIAFIWLALGVTIAISIQFEAVELISIRAKR